MQNKCPEVLICHISPKDSFSVKHSKVILENHPAPLSHCISYFKECDFFMQVPAFHLSNILEGFHSHKN